jgi:hypothetical protein
MAVVASPMLWMVSASSATLPDQNTTTSCKAAVIARMTNDHLMAHMPRSDDGVDHAVSVAVTARAAVRIAGRMGMGELILLAET